MARRISLLAPDCTIHSLPRCRILAQLLGASYEVEVVAPVFPGDDDGYSKLKWPGRYTPVPVRKLPGFARSAGDLLEALTGEVVYASKPRAPSFGVALMARHRRGLPVVVDLDDREIYHCYPYSFHMTKNLLFSLKEWAHPSSYPLTLAMEKLLGTADHVTSVSTYFRHLFGGTVVPQAVDTELFDPTRYDRFELRRQWGLEQYRVILFLGRPQPHKGLEEIVRAVELCGHPEARLVVAGGWTPYLESLWGQERIVFLGPQPFEKAPAFLSMADVVMVPQRDNPLSRGQMPVKVPEAMAMGVPVIASAVSDLAEQIGEGGIVVPPGDLPALAGALSRVLEDVSLSKSMAEEGINRCRRLYSVAAVRPTIERVFERYVGK